MEYRPLGDTGLRVSILGYGASPLGNVFGPIDENEGVACVRTALDLGVNLIDVSPYYGATRSGMPLELIDGSNLLYLLAEHAQVNARTPRSYPQKEPDLWADWP
jgi:L-galactose dehydrogenase